VVFARQPFRDLRKSNKLWGRGLKKFINSVVHNIRFVLRDWRGKLVIYSVATVCVVTVFLPFFFTSFTSINSFQGAVFASWVAGLILFILTGLIVVIVTLARPENDIIDSRVHNLLQRQQGPHIDYIAKKIVRLFEPYMSSVERTLHIVKYDDESEMFLVNQDTVLVYKSFLTDVALEYESRVGYQNAPAPPKNEEPCCLVYLRAGEKDIGGAETFNGEIARPFSLKIDAFSECRVEHRMVYWVKRDEPNRQLAIRFTRKMVVEVQNQLGTKAISVMHPAAPSRNTTIAAGKSATVVNLSDIQPGENENDYAFDFRLEIIAD